MYRRRGHPRGGRRPQRLLIPGEKRLSCGKAGVSQNVAFKAVWLLIIIYDLNITAGLKSFFCVRSNAFYISWFNQFSYSKL